MGVPGIETALAGLMEEGTIALDLQVISASVITDQPLLAWCEATYVKHGTSGVLDTGFSSLVFMAEGKNYKWEAAIIASVSNVSDTTSARTARPTAGERCCLWRLVWLALVALGSVHATWLPAVLAWLLTPSCVCTCVTYVWGGGRCHGYGDGPTCAQHLHR